MTEPLIVDTDQLNAASVILKSAAGQIPTRLPQFSVNGSDPLSAAIAAGSAQMEAPMAALPWIAEQGKQIADQAASDGASIDGAAEAAATGCVSAVAAVTMSQVAMDPTKPPEEMNGALLAGTCVAGAGTGVAVYGIGKMVRGIVGDAIK